MCLISVLILVKNFPPASALRLAEERMPYCKITVNYSVLNILFLLKTNLVHFCFCDSADEVLLKPSGAQLTVEFLEEHSFSVPVMVLRRDGLGMTLPPSSFGVNDVEHYIGKVLTHLVHIWKHRSKWFTLFSNLFILLHL